MNNFKERITTNKTAVETDNDEYNLKDWYCKIFDKYWWISWLIGVIGFLIFYLNNNEKYAFLYSIPFIIIELPWNYITRNWLCFVIDICVLVYITYDFIL